MMKGFGRRFLHTIISRDIIKPSSPTPSHLKTHHFSLVDQTLKSTFMPMVTFYESKTGNDSNPHDKTIALKKSLSQTLTKYYPFAGRFAKIAAAYVDCNDDGVEFLEASIDTTLSSFLKDSKHEDLDQFFPYGRVWNHGSPGQGVDQEIPLSVQVTHFQCGGVAVAVSLSHRIADGTSLIHFGNDWAKLTREKHEIPPINPQFVSYSNVNINFEGLKLEEGDDSVTRSFMFPDSKLNELKLKVIAMTAESGEPITNPTRVEVLNWLLFKSAVAAATTNNSGFFKPASTGYVINVRNEMVERLPLNRIGNHFMIMKIFTNNETDMKPEVYINDLMKQKVQIQNLTNIKAAFELVPNFSSEIAMKEQEFIDSAYVTSPCPYPLYEIDFGWGKPVEATFAGSLKVNSFIMIDAPNGDGIVVLVCLGKKDMAIFESDPELLAFC